MRTPCVCEANARAAAKPPQPRNAARAPALPWGRKCADLAGSCSIPGKCAVKLSGRGQKEGERRVPPQAEHEPAYSAKKGARRLLRCFPLSHFSQRRHRKKVQIPHCGSLRSPPFGVSSCVGNAAAPRRTTSPDATGRAAVPPKSEPRRRRLRRRTCVCQTNAGRAPPVRRFSQISAYHLYYTTFC